MKRIGDLMGDMLREEGAEGLKDVMRLREVWADIVGEKMASKTTPYRYEGGVLYIRVRSHVWAQEIHFEMERIKRGIESRTGIIIERIITRS